MTESEQTDTPPHKQTSSMNKNNAPIGLFDSGIGGLSIYKHIHQLLPHEQYLYFADTKNVPYGGREPQDIINLTLQAVDWLYQQNCKLIVIACNSASAHALEVVRLQYPDTPTVGLVPALKPAVNATQTKQVAVLATQATLDGKLLNDVITEFAQPQQVKVTKYFNPYLVPWVEAGMPAEHSTALQLKQQLHSFYENNIDQLVLGCTHYPFFRDYVEDYLQHQGWNMAVVDSGQAIALRVNQLLARHGLFNDETILHQQKPYEAMLDATKQAKHNIMHTGVNDQPPLKLYTSRYDNQLSEVIARLVPQPIETLI